jgi:ABC-type uncharacterized transport system ATPase subunit
MLVTISIGLVHPTWAQVSPQASHLISFSSWKSQQITEADNRIVRLSNRLTVLRGQKDVNINDINKLEVEHRVAVNAAQVVRDLTIEDYFNVYLAQFLKEPGIMEAAAHSLTPQEVTALLKMYLSSKDPGNQASNL